MPLTIPKSGYQAIQHLIRLSAADFNAFLEAVSKAEPSLDQDDFWMHVAKHAKQIKQAEIKSILHEIFQMDEARLDAANSGVETDEFVKIIVEAASSINSKGFRFKETDGKILNERLLRIFEGRKGLNITTKAMGVVVG